MAVAGVVAAGSALVVSTAAVPPLAALARSAGLVDRPGALKVQADPVPYLGGAAVLAGVAAAASSRLAGGRFPAAALVALLAAWALGTADDARGLPVPLRVGGLVAVGLVVAATFPTRLGGAGWVLVVVLVVLLANAANLVDGLDGLAGGVGLAAAAGFSVLLGGGGRLLALAMAGALAGFLVHNRPPARIYLGDGGAYVLGTALAVLVVHAWQRGTPVAVSAASLLLVAYPVAEVVCAVVRRRRARRGLAAGDRDHTYDVLVARGWPVLRVSLAFCLGQGALAAVGVAASVAGPAVAAVIVAAVAAALLAGAAAGGLLDPTPGGRPR